LLCYVFVRLRQQIPLWRPLKFKNDLLHNPSFVLSILFITINLIIIKIHSSKGGFTRSRKLGENTTIVGELVVITTWCELVVVVVEVVNDQK